jgi:hypothetical protein
MIISSSFGIATVDVLPDATRHPVMAITGTLVDHRSSLQPARQLEFKDS